MDGRLIHLRTKQAIKLAAFNPVSNSELVNHICKGREYIEKVEVFLATAYLNDNLENKDLLDQMAANKAPGAYLLDVKQWYEVRDLEKYKSYVTIKGIPSAKGTQELWYTFLITPITDNLELCVALHEMGKDHEKSKTVSSSTKRKTNVHRSPRV